MVLINYINIYLLHVYILKGQINSLALYNKGQNFAAGGYDGIISLWEIIQ